MPLLVGSVLVFTAGGSGTSIKFCSGFLNLLYRMYPPIANPNKDCRHIHNYLH